MVARKTGEMKPGFLENTQLQPPRKKSFRNDKHERVEEISWTTIATRSGREKSVTKKFQRQGQLQKVHMEEGPSRKKRGREDEGPKQKKFLNQGDD